LDGFTLKTRYLSITLGTIAIVSGLRVLLDSVLYDRASFLLFTLAVMISAWIGGWRIGLFATVLASFIGMWLFEKPFYTANVYGLQDGVQTGLFALTGAGISLLAGQLKNARLEAEQEAYNATRIRDELSEPSRVFLRVLRPSIGNSALPI
jgi:K+-sensing histidine kinase KdpD